MKKHEKPTVLTSTISDRHADRFGRRMTMRLGKWSDDSTTITIGLAQQIKDSSAPSKFGNTRVTIPVEFLNDIEYLAPIFVKRAREALAKLAAAQAAAKAQADADDSDVNTDNSQNEDDTQ